MVACIPGYPENSTNHTAIPAGTSTNRPDFTFTAVLWHLTGQRTTEQVRVSRTVSSCSAARSETVAGKMVERG